MGEGKGREGKGREKVEGEGRGKGSRWFLSERLKRWLLFSDLNPPVQLCAKPLTLCVTLGRGNNIRCYTTEGRNMGIKGSKIRPIASERNIAMLKGGGLYFSVENSIRITT